MTDRLKLAALYANLRYGKNYDNPLIKICTDSDGSPSGELEMSSLDVCMPLRKKKVLAEGTSGHPEFEWDKKALRAISIFFSKSNKVALFANDPEEGN